MKNYVLQIRLLFASYIDITNQQQCFLLHFQVILNAETI